MKLLSSYFSNQTIKQRFRFWVGLIIIGLGLAIIVSFYINGKADRLLETREQLKQVVSIQSLYIERWSQERMDTIKRFALSDNAVQHRIDLLTSDFEAYGRIQSDFDLLFFVDVDGYYRSSKDPNTGMFLGDRSYFQAARDKKKFISSILTSKQSGNFIITFTAPVLDSYGQFAGAVVGTVSTDLLDKLMNQLSFGKTGEVYVLDSEGKIVTMSGPNKSDANQLMDTEILRRARADAQSDQAYIGFHGKRVYGQYQWSSGRAWTVVGEITEEEVFENLNQLLITEILIMLIVLVLSFAATVTLASRIEKPIHFLVKGTKIIQNGNYSYQINQEAIRTAPVELRQLCQTYNTMASKLKDTITLLEHSAMVDQLTEVFNRRYIMLEGSDRLRACVNAGNCCSVILLDIDHFKKINDTRGHLIGDRVLRHVAMLLRQYADEHTIVARYGGEEFILLALNKNAEQSLQLAEKIRLRLINHPYEEDGIQVSITASLGVAEYSEAGMIEGSTLLEHIVSRADEALYRAKTGGRNRVALAE
ncbi:sensor domain-containing diguanylate cyclase [Paenibacillus hexagrammi]|uniref:Diguanylate cyclase n=1 Tax=Paenibacillus hexagrammi TaxID=2908839 RepID=A0ABY3SF15_9BACL|nr:diguanylate cyclase [Paenibacillus sp. YPD9-1]UJF32583.1 diguanylate cyclase [Paenibacillus sp. YPD9-1]